ncbi:DUF977 family protein [Escherichia albertii]|uniref:DUF977 family protein n=1 Tax=Escherichia albertii TaxID=208962 RepID=UPI001F3F0E2D|nr:DUF977 family protein [Escherichia albertii]EEW0787468.1 DUF977 family protein [Escherichia albertii]EJQ6146350.1 DUF977 family protein [Escherichia albertii]MCE7719132.1 DUF977 family protein [Escherichia albertii]MCE7724421.1 DUF977 family protein [Escherichia albertii]MCZ9235822.1 DUF977 family protein [Escherichia albertii]
MAKVFTPEQREELKKQIVELVHLNGRASFQQLAHDIGVSKVSASRLCRELAASSDVYNSGYGVFPSEQAHKDWIKACKKMSRAAVKKKSDPDLIYSLPDGEIRRYDRRHNIICTECRKSEVMQRILSFYQGDVRYLLK